MAHMRLDLLFTLGGRVRAFVVAAGAGRPVFPWGWTNSGNDSARSRIVGHAPPAGARGRLSDLFLAVGMGVCHAQSKNKAENICDESVGVAQRPEAFFFPVHEEKIDLAD